MNTRDNDTWAVILDGEYTNDVQGFNNAKHMAWQAVQNGEAEVGTVHEIVDGAPMNEVEYGCQRLATGISEF